MTIAEPLASVDEKALESEIGRTVPKLARTSAAFRQTESCGRYRKPRWGKSTVSSVSFKRYGENYRLTGSH
jgi:hypothetical protein